MVGVLLRMIAKNGSTSASNNLKLKYLLFRINGIPTQGCPTMESVHVGSVHSMQTFGGKGQNGLLTLEGGPSQRRTAAMFENGSDLQTLPRRSTRSSSTDTEPMSARVPSTRLAMNAISA